MPEVCAISYLSILSADINMKFTESPWPRQPRSKNLHPDESATSVGRGQVNRT